MLPDEGDEDNYGKVSRNINEYIAAHKIFQDNNLTTKAMNVIDEMDKSIQDDYKFWEFFFFFLIKRLEDHNLGISFWQYN